MLRARPLLIDTAVALALAAESVVELALGTFREPHGGLAAILAVATALPLAARRRAPLVVAFVVAGAAGAQVVLHQASPAGTYFAALLAAYSVAVGCAHPIARGVGLLPLLAVFSAHLALDAETSFDAGNVLFTYGPLLAVWLVGEGQRRRHERAGALEARASTLERETEERALRAAADERARIARELHDVVAHSMSMIVLQAGAARRIAEQDPARARDALATIETSGRQALAEMRRLLNVMRVAAGENGADDPSLRAPQPGLAQLETLVGHVSATGLPVTVRIDGTARPLPAGVDLSAFRIIQEALTNTLKHAHAANAEVVLRYRGHALELEVTDHAPRPVAAARPAVAGHGLIGMRERVALFGGEVRAGPAGDGFSVHAVLPIEPD
jgi:signal transduction histidine kinase